MTEGQNGKKTVPLTSAAALLLATAAVALGIVALASDGNNSGEMTSMGGMGMSHNMEHMQPLSIKGIGDPPSSSGGTRLVGVERDAALEFKLDARPVWWTIYGAQRVSAWAYNGIVPGPQIRVRNGQRVRIKFTNNLPEETTIHWHGIGVPNSQDGVPHLTQKPIKPGESFTYDFVARPAGDPHGSGTFLYHSHVDEDRQMSAGLSGVFIIDPADGKPGKTLDRTLVVSEWTTDASTGRTRGAMQMEGMFPNFFTINGKSFPDTSPINVKAGQRVRLRLVNAGQFAHPLHLHGTAFRIVARDGHATTANGLRDTVTLESGERADIEFKLPKGKWLLHCHIGHHLTNNGKGHGGLTLVINAT